jgi:hypothetical protein
MDSNKWVLLATVQIMLRPSTFDLTFTPFSAVFGGGCEKYLPLIGHGRIWKFICNWKTLSQALQLPVLSLPRYDRIWQVADGTARYHSLSTMLPSAKDTVDQIMDDHITVGINPENA